MDKLWIICAFLLIRHVICCSIFVSHRCRCLLACSSSDHKRSLERAVPPLIRLPKMHFNSRDKQHRSYMIMQRSEDAHVPLMFLYSLWFKRIQTDLWPVKRTERCVWPQTAAAPCSGHKRSDRRSKIAKLLKRETCEWWPSPWPSRNLNSSPRWRGSSEVAILTVTMRSSLLCSTFWRSQLLDWVCECRSMKINVLAFLKLTPSTLDHELINHPSHSTL